YALALWLQDVDPAVRLLMMQQGESLIGFIAGSLASYLGEQAIAEVGGPYAAAAYSLMQMLPAVIKIANIVADLAQAVELIVDSDLQSILTADPLRVKLAGECSDWMLIGEPSDQAVSISAALALNALLEIYIVGADTAIHRTYQTEQTSGEDQTPLG